MPPTDYRFPSRPARAHDSPRRCSPFSTPALDSNTPPPHPIARPTVLYRFMWSLITLISAYDAWLVYRYQNVIVDFEKNPLGLWLIQFQNGEVEIFLLAKALGTSVVIAVLMWLHRNSARVAAPVTSSVTAFQVGLFGYLQLF